ncbi:serine acetyltransferase [Runella sp. CRIBMP]|uniref:serine acetyltransferase n=1 Tax=Runella sp. CRIBMP TaxID=2683261 RepID=UPI001413469B|nr:serine acetyltransferase [Runella sp. CRIBMP]NBB22839.1 serine acetyltransferase [Runella sp. CRIBMP]
MALLKDLIQSDLFRITGKRSSWPTFIKYLYKPEFSYLFFLRISKHLTENKSFFLAAVSIAFYKYLTIKFGYEIPYNVKIGKGLRLIHLGGIIVNPLAIIGDNCTILRGVTIGSNRRGQRAGAPIVGNDVWIGANAALIGKILVGNNVMIAPNSYINVDIPDNSIVFGNPCIVKQNYKATEGYIDHKYE